MRKDLELVKEGWKWDREVQAFPGEENSKYKGPEAGARLAGSGTARRLIRLECNRQGGEKLEMKSDRMGQEREEGASKGCL